MVAQKNKRSSCSNNNKRRTNSQVSNGLNKEPLVSCRFSTTLFSTSDWTVLLSASLVFVFGYWFQQQQQQQQQSVVPLDRYKRLIEAFPAGGNVEITLVDGMGAGTFARTDIAKGETIIYANSKDALPNEETERQEWYPQLLTYVESALDKFPQYERPTVEHIVTVVVLLLEVDKGTTSKWLPYIDALPHNVSQMAWYWTDEEMLCVVPRQAHPSVLTADKLKVTLQNFHVVFKDVWSMFAPIVGIPYSRQQALETKAEWAYLMVKTRAFDNGKLHPIVDMINHDPNKSVPPFQLNGAIHHVATQDIAAGEQFFNSYGKVPPVKMADTYGFVDSRHAAYVNVPSLTAALQRSPNTRNVDLCTKKEMLFFGNITEGRVEAHFQHLHQTTYYKPFYPSKLPYQCVRVLLQSEDGPTIAKYMVEKLQQDAATYHAMATADHCQGDSGNYPLIRQSNTLTAQLLEGATHVARRAARGEIAYPGNT